MQPSVNRRPVLASPRRRSQVAQSVATVVCHEHEKGERHVGDEVHQSRGAAREMKVWPFGAALRGRLQTALMLRWLKTVVVSDGEKAPVMASGGDREDDH